ncbi:unnamed protein product, partial [Brassica oleracea var. botrytis]
MVLSGSRGFCYTLELKNEQEAKQMKKKKIRTHFHAIFENPIASATLAGDFGIGSEQLLLMGDDDDLLKIKNTYRPILSRKRKGL